MSKECTQKTVKGQEGLLTLQRASLEILSMFDSYCRNRNLIYYLSYGTLLGAVRHKGFIPWDDDIDICMPRKDYEQLLSEYEQFFPEKYVINHYTKKEFTTNSYIIRICNPSIKFTRRINGEDKLFDSFISIFPIDGMSDKAILRRFQEFKANLIYIYLRFIRSSQNGYGEVHHSIKEKVGMAINTLFKIGKRTDIRKVAAKLDKELSKYDLDNSNYVNTYGYMVTPMEYNKSYFGKPMDIEFEEKKFMAPSDSDSLLTIWYGDYMQLPPIEKRKPSHSVDVIIYT